MLAGVTALVAGGLLFSPSSTTERSLTSLGSQAKAENRLLAIPGSQAPRCEQGPQFAKPNWLDPESLQCSVE